MNRLLTIAALAIAAGSTARAGVFGPNVTNPTCAGGGKCANEIIVGDPVNVADGNTHHRITDANVRGTLQSLGLLRTYVSNDQAWANGQDSPVATNVPTPFGSSPFTTLGTTLRWWHNFYSMVHAPNFGSGQPAYLWDTDGHYIKYGNCSLGGNPSCWLPNLNTNQSVRDRLQWTGSAFILYKDGGGRYFYEAAYAPSGGSVDRYFLTRIETPDYAQAITITYCDTIPVTGCPTGGAGTYLYTPYIKWVTTPDGARLTFNYAKLQRTDSAYECVVRSVTLRDRPVGGGTSEKTLVTYAYRVVSKKERPGAIVTATYPTRIETYVYPTNQFQVQQGGATVRNHPNRDGLMLAAQGTTLPAVLLAGGAHGQAEAGRMGAHRC